MNIFSVNYVKVEMMKLLSIVSIMPITAAINMPRGLTTASNNGGDEDWTPDSADFGASMAHGPPEVTPVTQAAQAAAAYVAAHPSTPAVFKASGAASNGSNDALNTGTESGMDIASGENMGAAAEGALASGAAIHGWTAEQMAAAAGNIGSDELPASEEVPSTQAQDASAVAVSVLQGAFQDSNTPTGSPVEQTGAPSVQNEASGSEIAAQPAARVATAQAQSIAPAKSRPRSGSASSARTMGASSRASSATSFFTKSTRRTLQRVLSPRTAPAASVRRSPRGPAGSVTRRSSS